MVWQSIDETIGTRYFISYARADQSLASALEKRLAVQCPSVWRDLESIALGDDWMAEIERGLQACDEVVLLVSQASAQSRVVAEEIRIAEALSRPVRPFIIGELTDDIPGHIAHLNCHRLSMSAGTDMGAELARRLNADDDEADWKLRIVRRIHPPFTEQCALPSGDPVLAAMRGPLSARCRSMDPASTAWLNDGLVACASGDWVSGVETLAKHANASGTFASHYMLALHISQRERIGGLSTARVARALDAARQAAAIQTHPFAIMLEAVLSRDGLNTSQASFEDALSRSLGLLPGGREKRAEALRFIWALGPNVEALGRFKPAILASLKEHCDS